MLKEKMDFLKFKLAILKLRFTHKKLMKLNLYTLKWCVYHINKIGIPKSKEENELLKKILGYYDETVKDLNKDVERYRNFVWE